MAVLQPAQSIRDMAQQCSWQLAALPGVRPEAGIHPQEGLSKQLHNGSQPFDGRSDAEGAGASHAGQAANPGHLQSHDGQDHCRDPAADSGRCGNSRITSSCAGPKAQVQEQSQERLSGSHLITGQPSKLGSHAGHGGTAERGGEEQLGQSSSPAPCNAAVLHDGCLRECGGSMKSSLTLQRPTSQNLPASSSTSLNPSTALSSSMFQQSSMSLKSKRSQQSPMVTSPLTHRVAGHVMKMAALLTASVMTLALEINLDGRDGLWEIACSANSWLTSAAIDHGIPSKRINYQQGYDLYREQTWIRLAQERKKFKPRKIWISLPFTRWCRWSQVNYNTPERREVLEALRRKERKVLKWAKKFILDTLADDPDTDFYWEWPYPCYGWEQQPMLELEAGIHALELPWNTCRIDGCRYNMKDSNNQLFLRKQWAIKTTDEVFHRDFRAKCCPRNHQHGSIEGSETARTSYYPYQMVVSIVRHWRRQLAPLKHVRALCDQQITIEDEEDENWERRLRSKPLVEQDLAFSNVLPAEQDEAWEQLERQELPGDSQASRRSDQPSPEDAVLSSVPQQEREQWQARLQHYHRAAGHPSNKNLIHLFKDAGLPAWKIIMARNFRCSACESLKPGGTSSGSIPPAATHQLYQPWQAIGLDATDWLVPGQKTKIRFVLMVDLATKLKAVYVTKQYDFLEMQGDSTEEIIRAISEKWLCDKPKPQILIPDNSTPLKSKEMHEFCNSIGVLFSLPAEKESWAHGVVESSVRDLKMTASAIQLDQPTMEPHVTVLLACAALNSTEYTKGYTAFQWAYGKDYVITDEDMRTFADVDNQSDKMSYESLVRARQDAERVARKTRALRVMSRLKNSIVQPTQLVKVWRREWPAHLHQGRRGGTKKSAKPHWIGPGRVIFHEILPHQEEGDERRHIVWVLIGTQLMRCSVHSVRPLTETEQAHYEIHTKDDPTRWKSLADLLPQREFTDLTDQIPNERELEDPADLPEHPDPSSMLVPVKKILGKKSPTAVELVSPEERERRNIVERRNRARLQEPQQINDYGDEEVPNIILKPEDVPVPENMEEDSYEPSIAPSDSEAPLPEPLEKKPRLDNDEALGVDTKDTNMATIDRHHPPQHDKVEWLHQLVLEQEREWKALHNVLSTDMNFFTIEMDLNLVSHRSKKDFIRNPNNFLVKKLKDSEVSFGKLSNEHRALFNRAKGREVSSFVQNEAVRRCINDQEIREALGSGRILRARWVLTWKLVPPEDQTTALEDSKNNPETLHTRDGLRKAKARIVLLGYEHPELGSSEFKTSSPVQSMLARNALYQIVCQHDWSLEGLDLATAFLQTNPTDADAQLWTSGVAELREALQVGPEGIMKIMRNIYGSTTAPKRVMA